MKTILSIVLFAFWFTAFAAQIGPAGRPPVRGGGPAPGWYGTRFVDLRQGVPDELSIVDIRDGGKVVRRAEGRLTAAGKGSLVKDGRDVDLLVAKAVVVDSAKRKAGDVFHLVLFAQQTSNWSPPGPLKQGRYLVMGMNARHGYLPMFAGVWDVTDAYQAENSDEVYGLVIFPTRAATLSTAPDAVERIIDSLVEALPGAPRANMVRITSFMISNPFPADDSSSMIRQAPVGWEKTLYGLVRRTKDRYFRAKGLEVLMWHRVEHIEGEFATALMDCANDPDAFVGEPDYGGLGPSFEGTAIYAMNAGDRDYWTRSPYDHDRATRVALRAKNDHIRRYLVAQVLWAPTSPADWAAFVKLLQQPPAPYWQEMLVDVFARWRGDKPTPKIEYGVVGGRRQVTNMPELVQFYTNEYPGTRP